MRRKASPVIHAAILREVVGHALIGAALGLGCALALISVDTFGVTVLIAHSDEPRTTMLVLAGMFTLAFGVGATMTGIVFTMMQER